MSGVSVLVAIMSAVYSRRSDRRSKEALAATNLPLSIYLSDAHLTKNNDRDHYFFECTVANPATQDTSVKLIELHISVIDLQEKVQIYKIPLIKLTSSNVEVSLENVSSLSAGQMRKFLLEFESNVLAPAASGKTKRYELVMEDTRGRVARLSIGMIRSS